MRFEKPAIWLMKITPGGSRDTRTYFENLFIKEGCKNVIGYTKEEGKIEEFSARWQRIDIGDIVIIIEGANRVFGAVEILSDAWDEDSKNSDMDWFYHRRKVRLIKQFDPFITAKSNTNRDTIIEYSGDGAVGIIDEVWEEIKVDYQTLKLATLMEKSKIDERTKQRLQELWQQFKNKYSDTQKGKIMQEYSNLLNDWKVYTDKITNDEFKLSDFTNRLANSTGLPGGYLCNFLERSTRNIFGSAKPGNSFNYGIKKNDDDDTYTIKGKKEPIQRQSAEEEFNSKFIPFFKQLIASDLSINNKISLVEENVIIPAKQILRKILVLQAPEQFINIYSTDVIEQLFSEFVQEEAPLYTPAKNKLICILVSEALEINTTDSVQQCLLSLFLWEYAHVQAIVDKNDPNVILYGPPGTGKTYQVLNDLLFVTKENGRQTNHLQFHPSFTYEDFIEGLRPTGVGKDGNIQFGLVNGVFKKFCIRAKENPMEDFYFVVDEINRANLSTVFGEVLFALEKNYRRKVRFNNEEARLAYSKKTDGLVKTQYSAFIEQLDEGSRKKLVFEEINGEVYFGVPENVFFIGMMNDVDKSIDTFDLALRRRFKWIRKDCDYDVIVDNIQFKGRPFENIEKYIEACRLLNSYISLDLGLGKSYEFGHAFFMKIQDLTARKNITKKNVEQLFHIHLYPTLKEYLRAFFAETELDKNLEIALEKFKSPISI